jgi:hypothetical protein
VTGLLFLPMTALVALANPLVARIARRFGRLTPIIAGQISMAGGLIGRFWPDDLAARSPANAAAWSSATGS